MNTLLKAALLPVVLFGTCSPARSQGFGSNNNNDCAASIGVRRADQQIIVETLPGAYDETNVWLPSPVGLAIEVRDLDIFRAICSGVDSSGSPVNECIEKNAGGTWNIDWAFEAAQTPGIENGQAGILIAHDGEQVASIDEADGALYQPPIWMDCGTDVLAEVVATVTDIGLGGNDPVTRVTYSIRTARQMNGRYRVNIEGVDIDLPDEPNFDGGCPNQGIPGCCRVGPFEPGAQNPQQTTFIEGLVDYPVSGMITGRVRPLVAKFTDKDTVLLLCGEGTSCTDSKKIVILDSLQFKWTIDPLSSGEFLHHDGDPKVAWGQTVFYKSDEAITEQVKIKLDVFDTCPNPATTACISDKLHFSDPDVPVEIEFRVYDFDLIDGSGSPLKRHPADATGSIFPSLQIGESPPNVNLPPGPAPYDPPSTTAENYRMQVCRVVDGAVPTFKLKSKRGAADTSTSDWIGVQSADSVSEPVGVTSCWRSQMLIRLVSNGPPNPQPAGSEYDDEVAGNQTVLVRPGDRLEGSLYIDDAFVGAISLPVGRVGGEYSSPASHNKYVNLEGRIKFSPVDYQPLEPAPALAEQLAVQRASEDWAQAGISWSSVGVETIEPIGNGFSLKMILVPTAGANGVISFDFITSDGTQHLLIEATITQGDPLDAIVAELKAKIEQRGPVVQVYGHVDPYGVSGQLLVIDPEEVGARIENFVAPLASQTFVVVDVIEGTPSYQAHISSAEAHLLAINYPHTANDIVRAFVTPIQTGQLPYIPVVRQHVAYAWNEGQGSLYPELINHLMMPEVAVDHNDSGYSIVLGHELGHIVLDGVYHHQTDTTRLMYKFGASGSPETPGYFKRLYDRDELARFESGPSTFPVLLRADL